MYDHLLFDMDGTLTEARMPIDPEFAASLTELCKRWSCIIVTGSDYQKVYEQLGADLCKCFNTIYTCNGNVSYKQHRVDWWSAAHNWQLSSAQKKILQGFVEKSKFPLRTGNHIEQRIGMTNFSIVGRNATAAEREQYRLYDQATGERSKIIGKLRERKAFADLDLVLGGQTSIDIYPRGFNKAQVRQRIPGNVLFFGDKCELGGNDFEIAMACSAHHQVSGWQQTYELLRELTKKGPV